jgi:hypothetical protein
MRAHGRLIRLERAYAVRRLRTLNRVEMGEVLRLLEAVRRDGWQALGVTRQARMKALARLFFVEII